jgi:hypothetical protein
MVDERQAKGKEVERKTAREPQLAADWCWLAK